MARKIDEPHSKRLDAIGAVAAALPHEINQPLTTSAAYMGVAHRLLKKTEQGYSDVPAVYRKATAQTERIVRSLKDLRRRDEPDKTLLSMHELLCDARNAFLPDAAPARFAFRRSCAAEKCRALAEWAPFRQALANLIHDADRAMPVNVAGQLLIATNSPNDKTISVDVADRGVDCRTPWMKAVSNYSSRPRRKGISVGLSIFEIDPPRANDAKCPERRLQLHAALQDSDLDS